MFEKIISKKNLFAAWREFRVGKKNKTDVRQFAFDLEENLISLQNELRKGLYVHGPYVDFFVCDPKHRHIHKALVRDRVVHHAIHRVLYPIWDKSFIFDSFSSRLGKGTHIAVDRFEELANRQSANNTRTVWVMKCDVRKFFDSVDHGILLKILGDKLNDEKLMRLLSKVIQSFQKKPGNGPAYRQAGLPLGNLTSQLFANIYLDGLDNFVKRDLRVRGYLRYADDLLFICQERSQLETWGRLVADYMSKNRMLALHPAKTIIGKWHSGVDVLGYISFPHHRLLRSRTARRALSRATSLNLSSYLGLLKHCRGHGLAKLLS